MRSAQSTATVRRRYGWVASIYDWASLERVVYAGYPEGGRRGDAVIPRPVAWALSKLFAADCTRRPWRLLRRDTGKSDDRAVHVPLGNCRLRGKGSRMSTSAQQLHESADRQIVRLIECLNRAGGADLTRPCSGRARLGDGTVGAVTAHTADNYLRIADFVSGRGAGGGDHLPGQYGERHRAREIELEALLGRLAAARDAIAKISRLSDEQLDSVPPAGAMKFADGERTLQQILANLLKHQRHQVDALAAALS
jgi:hypothetical protein